MQTQTSSQGHDIFTGFLIGVLKFVVACVLGEYFFFWVGGVWLPWYLTIPYGIFSNATIFFWFTAVLIHNFAQISWPLLK